MPHRSATVTRAEKLTAENLQTTEPRRSRTLSRPPPACISPQAGSMRHSKHSCHGHGSYTNFFLFGQQSYAGPLPRKNVRKSLAGCRAYATRGICQAIRARRSPRARTCSSASEAAVFAPAAWASTSLMLPISSACLTAAGFPGSSTPVACELSAGT